VVDLTPQELQVWLEWAGARLIAMPGPRIGPADIKVIWPEYSQEKFEILDFRNMTPLRAPGPSKDEIPIMEEILTLPALCSDPLKRRVLHSRALIHPVNSRHLYSWRKIALLLGRDAKTIKTWHTFALSEVCRRATNGSVCRIYAFMQAAAI
jgi:hypothetical protein